MKVSDNIFPKVLLTADTAAATPVAGTVAFYGKSGGGLFYKTAAGTEYELNIGPVSFADLTFKPTTVAGYGISDVETSSSGVYTPTLTGILNVASVTAPLDWYYIRVGTVVIMAGQLNVFPTASATITEVQVSLPVASNFAAFGNASGSGSSSNGTSLTSVGINASAANDRIRVLFNSVATTSHNIFAQAIYQIIP